MPNKITKLTPDQIARFAEWTEEWIKIGLSTEPAAIVGGPALSDAE